MFFSLFPSHPPMLPWEHGEVGSVSPLIGLSSQQALVTFRTWTMVFLMLPVFSYDLSQ